jgi:hypothetical protein
MEKSTLLRCVKEARTQDISAPKLKRKQEESESWNRNSKQQPP